MTNISVELPGLKLKNPLMPASGTFGFGDLPEKFNYDEMGAMVLKTTTPKDVVEFMEAGASAVAVGSAHFKDALAIPHIVSQLPKVLSDLGINDINDLGGKAKI